MTSESWKTSVQPVVEQVMRARAVPGMVIVRLRRTWGDNPPEHLVVGTDLQGRPLAEDSLLPVASITKLATALAVLRLVERGVLGLDDPLARHLPDAAAAREGVTPRRLLSHTAGLSDDVAPELAPYGPALDWPTLARACLATAPVTPPGVGVSYSNVGPGLLAVVVERLTGRQFSAALRELVLEPLGIEAYLGEEPPRAAAGIAGDLGEHTGTELDPYNSPFWRSLALPWGGLVTTAAGALALVRAFAGRPAGFLSPALLAEATRDQADGRPGRMVFLEWPRCPWGLGVELRGDKTPHWTPAEASPIRLRRTPAPVAAWPGQTPRPGWPGPCWAPASSSTGGRPGRPSARPSWPRAALRRQFGRPDPLDAGVARGDPGCLRSRVRGTVARSSCLEPSRPVHALVEQLRQRLLGLAQLPRPSFGLGHHASIEVALLGKREHGGVGVGHLPSRGRDRLALARLDRLQPRQRLGIGRHELPACESVERLAERLVVGGKPGDRGQHVPVEPTERIGQDRGQGQVCAASLRRPPLRELRGHRIPQPAHLTHLRRLCTRPGADGYRPSVAQQACQQRQWGAPGPGLKQRQGCREGRGQSARPEHPQPDRVAPGMFRATQHLTLLPARVLSSTRRP